MSSIANAAAKATKKHVFICYMKTDILDTQNYDTIQAFLLQRGVRVYQEDPKDNINDVIAKGVENAAVVLVIISPAMQASTQGPKKILNYADQLKLPILQVNPTEDFEPTDWLGTTVASATEIPFDDDEAMLKGIKTALKGDLSPIMLEKGESGVVKTSKPLFIGSSANKTIEAYFVQGTKKFPMTFKYFSLHNGEIDGEGSDQFGQFSMKGKYPAGVQYGDMKFVKAYESGVKFQYDGSYHIRDTECVLSGQYFDAKVRDDDKDMNQAEGFEITVSFQVPSDDANDDSKTGGTIKQSFTKIVLSYSESQKTLAEKLASALRSKAGLDVLVPAPVPKAMISIASSQAAVVVPLMSHDYQNSEACKQVLTYVDKANIPIVPVRAEVKDEKFMQSGWLGVICAGSLWVDVTKEKEFDQKVMELKSQIDGAKDKRSKGKEIAGGTKLDGTGAVGYYMSGKRLENQKREFKFDLFTMVNGVIAGQGKEAGLDFVVSGTYELLENDSDNFSLTFTTSYLKEGSTLKFEGTTTNTKTLFKVNGIWWDVSEDDEDDDGDGEGEGENGQPNSEVSKSNGIEEGYDDGEDDNEDEEDEEDEEDDEETLALKEDARKDGQIFYLEVGRRAHEDKEHVMLSYNWNNQPLVKRICEEMKAREIPVWMDVNGDMKGNINSSMADGVENALVVVSFLTTTYSKSANCQKEFNYATQMDKWILPVLLEDTKKFQGSWLETHVTKFVQDNEVFEVAEGVKEFTKEQMDDFCDRLNQMMIEAWGEEDDDDDREGIETVFEGGKATGEYYQSGQAHPTSFEFFSLRNGYVVGQGQDDIGPFTIAGTYEADNTIKMEKQYILPKPYSVNYEGKISVSDKGVVSVKGTWNLNSLHDEFRLVCEETSADGPDTLFDGVVEGFSTKNGQREKMYFDYFTLMDGRVLGNGEDEDGPFSVIGTYDEKSGAFKFEKSYAADDNVHYEGTYTLDNDGVLRLHGKWDDPKNREQGKFQLEGSDDVGDDEIDGEVEGADGGGGDDDDDDDVEEEEEEEEEEEYDDDY